MGRPERRIAGVSLGDVAWWLRGKVDRLVGRVQHWALERINRD